MSNRRQSVFERELENERFKKLLAVVAGKVFAESQPRVFD